MGFLDSMDRRNQRVLEKRNKADPVGPAGGTAVSSGLTLLKIAPATVIGVIVVLATARNVWSVVGAVVLLVVGGFCCLVLAHDVKSDGGQWRKERASKHKG
jgi:membrane protein YdbS with pleckstrin-like domain